VILLAEHDEPSLAAKKKQRPVALEKATSTQKNRVWNFFGSPLGRTCSEPDLSAETATGSVQYSYETASGRGYYYTRDHLGSVREMCGSSGAIVARYSYDPYGRTTLVSGTNLATKQYAGYYSHQTSGLYLTSGGLAPSTGRPYDPTTGKWLSRDPAGENGGLNLYGYVSNDPIIYADKFGLWDGSSPDFYPTVLRPKDPCPCAEWQLSDSAVVAKKVYVKPKYKSLWDAWKDWYPDTPEHYAKYVYISVGFWFCPTSHARAVTGNYSDPGSQVPPNDQSPKVEPPFVGPPSPKGTK